MTPGRTITNPYVTDVISWYQQYGRDLPWRSKDCTPWGILVSEVMLQQTPVIRVEPVWREWVARWPEPAALASTPPREAVRAWGRLGYPRRALRLHEAATQITTRHGGQVPQSHDDLLALAGVGEYTAAAVATFAYGQRHVVLDTNVRRVLARVAQGKAFPGPSPTAEERVVAASLLPVDVKVATQWSTAVMELGALVCSARTPRCGDCPVAQVCSWREAGHPAYAGPPRRGQAWHGTDRQVRGRLLAALREHEPRSAKEFAGIVPDEELKDPQQRSRCLASLIKDGLIEAEQVKSRNNSELTSPLYRLPTELRLGHP
ncbi:MAG: A/G-specific adenine glycosylase [Actinomycetota bacterium]